MFAMKKFLWTLPLVGLFVGRTHAANLANISLDFCTTKESTLTYHLDSGVTTGICYTITNASDASVKVKVWFIDGTFTNDQQQNKACLSDDDVEKFGKYVTNSGQIVALKGWETVKREAKLLYATGMNGLFHGCIVYSLVEDKPNTISGFTIIMRKAKFIDVFLGNLKTIVQGTGIVLEEFSNADGENISNDPKVRIYKDTTDNTYVVQIKIHNVSSVEQDVMITWDISNILWYNDTFVESRKILNGELLVITKNIWEVQPYNLKIKFTINNTPFSFDTPAQVNWTIQQETVIWMWKVIWYVVVMLIILFGGIIMLLSQEKKRRKKRAVHHAHHTHAHEAHHPHHIHHPHDPHHQHHTEKK